MKQLTKAMFLSALFCLTAMIGSAAEKSTPEATAPKKFDDLRAAAVSSKAPEIKNGRIVYLVQGKDVPTSYLLLRSEVGKKLRVDIITSDDVISSCRNGDFYWGNTTKEGEVKLSAEEIEEMKIDTPFFPFPFLKDEFYAPLSLVGSGVFRDNECRSYATSPRNDSSIKLNVWVDNATQRLCLVSFESKDGIYQTAFRDYREFEGVDLPTRLYLSSANDVIIMTLLSVEWNVELAPGIFDKGGDLEKDPRLADLQKKLAKADVVKAEALKEYAASEQARLAKEAKDTEKREDEWLKEQREKRIAKLRLEVEKLTLQVEEKTKQKDALEEYIAQTYKGALDTAQEYARHPYIYRRVGGWGRWGHTSTKKNRTMRRLAKDLYREGEDATKEYEALARELPNLRVKLSEAQAQLDAALKSAEKISKLDTPSKEK